MSASNPIDLASLAPVARLDPAAHRHHDILAAVLDAFCAAVTSADARAVLVGCVAQQLLSCRCKEGRSIRRAIRLAVTHLVDNVPISLVGGTATIEMRGLSYRWQTEKGKPVYHPNAYRRAGGRPRYRRSTRHIAVTADVVLTLAGLRSLLPSAIPAVPAGL